LEGGSITTSLVEFVGPVAESESVRKFVSPAPAARPSRSFSIVGETTVDVRVRP
jgi:hypothetical protein